MVDIEQFPTSQSAKRMMKTVSPIYDKAYVAKWIYQVMGVEIDEAWQFFNELRLQAFPETATWGIVYWEQRYHIAPDENLTIEERRRRVIARRSRRGPMNPAKMEQIAQDVTGRPVEVTEQNEAYVFFVSIFPGESDVDYQELIKKVKSAKPSHLSFTALFETNILLSIRADRQSYAFGYPLCGTTPQTNIEGALCNEMVDIEAGATGYAFDYPFAGTGDTGTVPDTNTMGGIENGSILPSIAATGSAFDYQLCGESEREL